MSTIDETYYHSGPAWLVDTPLDTNNLPNRNGLSEYWVNCHNLLHYADLNQDFSDLQNVSSQIRFKQLNLTIQKEHIFEAVRVESFSSAPSRKRCIFLISKQQVKGNEWTVLRTQVWRKLFKVIPSDGHHILKVDSKWLDCNAQDIEIIVNNAKSYWSGAMTKEPLVEYLYSGVLKFEPSNLGIPV